MDHIAKVPEEQESSPQETAVEESSRIPYPLENVPDYPKDQPSELLEKAKTDMAAKTEVAEKYLKLIKSVAAKFGTYVGGQWRSRINTHPEIWDLVSEGLEELYNAIDTYDPSKGKFSTYAWTVIEQRFKNLERDSKRLQKNVPIVEQSVPKSEEELHQEYQKYLDEMRKHEIKERLGLPTERPADVKPEKVVKVPLVPGSLEQSFGEDEESKKLIDVIEDAKQSSTDEAEWEELVQAVVNNLPNDRLKKVFIYLVKNYGRPGAKSDLAKLLNVSESSITNFLVDMIPAAKKVLEERGYDISKAKWRGTKTV